MRLLATITIGLIVGATILASSGAGGRLFGFVRHIPGQDVTAHFLLYAALGLTVSTCLQRSPRPVLSANWLWFVGGIAALATAEECSQALLATRTFSSLDLAASLGGLGIGSWASTRLPPTPQKV